MQYDQLRMEQTEASVADLAMRYYQNNGTWIGLDAWLMESLIPPRLPAGVFPPIQFVMADADGIVIIGSGPFQIGRQLTSDEIAQGTPITVDGQQAGILLPPLNIPELDPREQRYISGMNRALLIGGVGAAAAALLIASVLSRHFLSPLTELTRAIKAMKQGNLEQQVEVRTQDELGELAQTFNQMSAEIHRVNQLRRQMTADIAHDLRTPLTVISGYVEALKDGTLPPTQERFEVINQEVTLLRRLIEDLRILSLADAGELNLLYQDVWPHDLLKQVVHSFQPLAVAQDIRLEVIADQMLPVIQADPERMVQVLENLVSNAVRHTPHGGQVTLTVQHQQSGLQITVRDTGAGIPADKLPNIFERLYRVEPSRSDSLEESGSGLGLAIVKSIVEAHGGAITAESTEGSGTSIQLTLPIENQHLLRGS